MASGRETVYKRSISIYLRFAAVRHCTFASMPRTLVTYLAIAGFAIALAGDDGKAQDFPGYHSDLNVAYSLVAGRILTLNAFLSTNSSAPVPAVVEIHGGWWFGGGAASQVDQVGGWQILTRRRLAVFQLNIVSANKAAFQKTFGIAAMPSVSFERMRGDSTLIPTE